MAETLMSNVHRSSAGASVLVGLIRAAAAMTRPIIADDTSAAQTLPDQQAQLVFKYSELLFGHFFCIQLLYSHQLASVEIQAKIYRTIGALPDDLTSLPSYWLDLSRLAVPVPLAVGVMAGSKHGHGGRQLH